MGPMLESSEFFASYQLIELIGVGGSARVFRARHVHPQYSEQSFAVKILHEGLLQHAPIRTLFRNEGYFLSLLDHPNIVHTHEAGIEGEHPYIAMEYVDGVNLASMLKRMAAARESLSRPIALHIMREVLTGLAFAHRLNDADGKPIQIVHRDINPGNVFLSYDGETKLADFGVAVLAGQSLPEALAAGTPGHFAPEQLAAGALEQTADVYACGILMYGLLCGRWPFEADDIDDIFTANQNGQFTRPRELAPDLTPELEAVLLRALQFDPAKRYPDAAAMLAELDAHAPGPAGMDLAVRSVLRTVFFREHVRALQMRIGLTGQVSRFSGLRVEVHSSDATARDELTEMLRQGDIACADPEEEPQLGPRAVLVDIRTQVPRLADIRAWVKGPDGRIAPVVLLARSIDPGAITLAHLLHAVDLVSEPLTPERLHAAASSALFYAQRAHRQSSTSLEDRPKVRVMLASSDGELCARICAELAQHGYAVTAVGSTEQAAAHLCRASPRAAICDLAGDMSDTDAFADCVRGAPGMGMVPILFLRDSDDRPMLWRAKRTASRPRDDAGATLATALDQLHGDVRHGRAFSRFRVTLPAELTYGGRMYEATATDISRGGTMLRCQGMLPVGADAAICLRFGGEEVRMRGHILRVAPGDDDVSVIGVRIARISPDMETRLIGHIRALQQTGA